MSRFTLANIYKELKIGYQKLLSTFFNNRTQEEYRDLILLYLKNLVHHIKKNREILFFDETTTNMWDLRRKIWQPKNSRLPLVV